MTLDDEKAMGLAVKTMSSRQWKQFQFNSRVQVGRLRAVTYLDSKLCRAGLGLSPAGVEARLAPHVAKIRATRRGVYIVLTQEELPAQSLLTRGRQVRKLLPEGPAGNRQ